MRKQSTTIRLLSSNICQMECKRVKAISNKLRFLHVSNDARHDKHEEAVRQWVRVYATMGLLRHSDYLESLRRQVIARLAVVLGCPTPLPFYL